MTPSNTPPAGSTTRQALYIADDLALDFINSEFGPESGRVECLGDDAQVIAWLRNAGVDVGNLQPPQGQRGTLLAAALALRKTARDLVMSRKAGRAGDPTALNLLLARGATWQELVWKKAKAPERVLHRRVASEEDLLLPVAEAVANLVVEGDFDLIRKCENPDCTLLFYDRTKAHRRRWCDMAACGNRMKVAAFRARQSAD
ncbi:MAG TPA: CGNR zinc finger domain-containing protein [Burkholderiales bacterium]